MGNFSSSPPEVRAQGISWRAGMANASAAIPAKAGLHRASFGC
jgi:hypothetical protein